MTLKEDAESLSLDVQDAEQNVASYEQQADSDEAMIEEVGAPPPPSLPPGWRDRLYDR